MTDYLEPKQETIEIKEEPDTRDYTNHEILAKLAKAEALNEEMLSLLKEFKTSVGEVILSHTFFLRVQRVIAEAESHEPGK